MFCEVVGPGPCVRSPVCVLGRIFRRTPGDKTAAFIVVDGLTQAMAFDFLSTPNTFFGVEDLARTCFLRTIFTVLLKEPTNLDTQAEAPRPATP